MKHRQMIHNVLPPAVLAVVLLCVYLASMPSGLTWANNGADGGDLATAAAVGGVAHPSGYPTYLFAARLFQLLPIGTLAYRTNLLSAVAAVMAALLVYGTVCRLPESPAYGSRLAGLTAGGMFGLAPLVWSQAVITEVYTLHALFCALLLLVSARTASAESAGRLDAAGGLTLGLAAGNHITSLFLIPPVLLSARANGTGKIQWKPLARILGGFFAGLLVYLALPLRALSNPPVNWGNPVTLRQFGWLVTGDLYQRRLLNLPVQGIVERLQDLAAIFLRQFEIPGLMLALFGLIFYFKPGRLYFAVLWNFVLFTIFALLYASPDSYLYLIPAFLSVSIWIGIGLGGLLKAAVRFRGWVVPAAAIAIGLFAVVTTAQRWPLVDASHDDSAEQFGAQIMKSAPQDAILFVESDPYVFGLWYFHFGLKQRPDLTVIAADLLHFDWYAQNLAKQYPGVNWPEGLPWQQTITDSNPGRSVCVINDAQEERMLCLVP